MKKTFKLEDLDCANCAAKMERAIEKIEGVELVTISFMAQKMVLEADEALFEGIFESAVKCIKKVDPNCSVIIK
ncbi:MAG: heavy-metal-associated domain-containing protein [Clostridia bacterium]|nr:heavy-metal-associated domain-containing protein [Clostridia bacterium]